MNDNDNEKKIQEGLEPPGLLASTQVDPTVAGNDDGVIIAEEDTGATGDDTATVEPQPTSAADVAANKLAITDDNCTGEVAEPTPTPDRREWIEEWSPDRIPVPARRHSDRRRSLTLAARLRYVATGHLDIVVIAIGIPGHPDGYLISGDAAVDAARELRVLTMSVLLRSGMDLPTARDTRTLAASAPAPTPWEQTLAVYGLVMMLRAPARRRIWAGVKLPRVDRHGGWSDPEVHLFSGPCRTPPNHDAMMHDVLGETMVTAPRLPAGPQPTPTSPLDLTGDVRDIAAKIVCESSKTVMTRFNLVMVAIIAVTDGKTTDPLEVDELPPGLEGTEIARFLDGGGSLAEANRRFVEPVVTGKSGHRRAKGKTAPVVGDVPASLEKVAARVNRDISAFTRTTTKLTKDLSTLHAHFDKDLPPFSSTVTPSFAARVAKHAAMTRALNEVVTHRAILAPGTHAGCDPSATARAVVDFVARHRAAVAQQGEELQGSLSPDSIDAFRCANKTLQELLRDVEGPVPPKVQQRRDHLDLGDMPDEPDDAPDDDPTDD